MAGFYTFFGILHLGAVPVPIYPTLGIDAMANIFRNCDARTVVCFDWFRESVEASRAGATAVRDGSARHRFKPISRGG